MTLRVLWLAAPLLASTCVYRDATNPNPAIVGSTHGPNNVDLLPAADFTLLKDVSRTPPDSRATP
jgi:hypothetical protein